MKYLLRTATILAVFLSVLGGCGNTDDHDEHFEALQDEHDANEAIDDLTTLVRDCFNE